MTYLDLRVRVGCGVPDDVRIRHDIGHSLFPITGAKCGSLWESESGEKSEEHFSGLHYGLKLRGEEVKRRG